MRRRPWRTLAILCAVGLFGASGPSHHVARASSPSATVWVIDDVTNQAGCTNGHGAPCPAGSVQVFNVYHVLAEAAGKHRWSLHGDASTAEASAWAQSVAVQQHEETGASASLVGTGAHGFPASGGAAVQSVGRRQSRTSCPSTNPAFNDGPFVVNLLGATISATLNNQTDTCSQHRENWFQDKIIAGQIWAHDEVKIYDGAGSQKDITGPIGCRSLNNSMYLTRGNWFGGTGAHTYQSYSSGSHCFYSDTFTAVNFWWSV